MSSKKDNKKDKDNKNKKRDKPEQKEYQWEDTELKDPNNTSMLAQDVKQLLITRGEKKQSLKGKKVEMIEFLKEKYDVELKEPIEDLTCKELIVELRLRGLLDTNAKKEVLVSRLKGEIDASAPPAKKQKRGKKAKNTVYVTLYTPPASAEENGTKVLGVFKSESKAFEKGIAQLLDDIEDKYGESKQKKIDSAYEKVEKIDKKKYRDRMIAVTEAVNKAFNGKEDDAPYCEINDSTMTQ